MAVNISSVNDTVTAYLDGEIDHHNAKDIRTQIDDTLNRTRPNLLVLDFNGVSFMDSSGIGLVMGRYRQLMQLNCGRLHVTGVTNQTAKVMRLAGLERLAKIDEVVKK